jgi:DNA-cytosine methyltransferase
MVKHIPCKRGTHYFPRSAKLDPKVTKKKTVSIGSVCSGLGVDMMAMQSLLPSHDLVHEFACDKLESSKIWFDANFTVNNWFDDVTSKKFFNKAKHTTVFTAGFPCQPFSGQGLHGGEADERGTVVFHITKHIRRKLPKVFLLENVPGLLQRHPATLLKIMKRLRSIIGKNGKPAYSVSFKVLDSGDYGGVPQHRPRLYIAGILNTTKKAIKIPWPSAIAKPSLASILLMDDLPRKERRLYPTAPHARRKVKVPRNSSVNGPKRHTHMHMHTHTHALAKQARTHTHMS